MEKVLSVKETCSSIHHSALIIHHLVAASRPRCAILHGNKMTFFYKIREMLPEWGPVRWTAVILALAVLLSTGVSLFYAPTYEVMYSPTRVVSVSEKGDRFVFYSVEVGNTGRKVQEDVRLRFLGQAMDRAIIAPSAQDYGVSHRPIVISNDQATTTIGLGRLDPEARVTLTLLLSYPKGQDPHTWEALFLGLDPARGSAKRGNPGMTMVGRAWFGLFGNLLPF